MLSSDEKRFLRANTPIRDTPVTDRHDDSGTVEAASATRVALVGVVASMIPRGTTTGEPPHQARLTPNRGIQTEPAADTAQPVSVNRLPDKVELHILLLTNTPCCQPVLLVKFLQAVFAGSLTRNWLRRKCLLPAGPAVSAERVAGLRSSFLEEQAVSAMSESDREVQVVPDGATFSWLASEPPSTSPTKSNQSHPIRSVAPAKNPDSPAA